MKGARNTRNTIVVTSESPIKLKVVNDVFNDVFKPTDEDVVIIVGESTKNSELPEQPITDSVLTTYYFAKERINYLKSRKTLPSSIMYVSIENGLFIDNKEKELYDICYVVICCNGIMAEGYYSVKLPESLLPIYSDYTSKTKLINYGPNIQGYEKTFGEYLNNNNKTDNKTDWIKEYTNITRHEQITKALKKAFDNWSNSEYQKTRTMLQDKVRVFNNCSYGDIKDSITFYDVFPLFSTTLYLSDMFRYLGTYYRYDNIDVIVGLESRGFCIGVGLASQIKKPFVPIRKAGKLPGECYSITYEKEYGVDKIEIQKSALLPKTRVLLVDDVMATGGSMKAAVDLIRKCDCIVVDCCVLKEVVLPNQTPVTFPITIFL